MEVGDCVNLQTGGYLMTVRCVGSEFVICNWFDTSQNFHEGTFRKSDLVRWVQA